MFDRVRAAGNKIIRLVSRFRRPKLTIHPSTNWQIATDVDFKDIVFSSAENTIPLSSIVKDGIPNITKGNYHVRDVQSQPCIQQVRSTIPTVHSSRRINRVKRYINSSAHICPYYSGKTYNYTDGPQ